MVINLELPWPPSINDTYSGRKGGGGLYKKKEAKRWAADAAWTVKFQLPHGHKPITEPLVCRIEFTPPSGRNDIDNGIKATLDALQSGLAIENDRQIKRLEIDMKPPKSPGYVRLALHSLKV